MDKKDKKDEVQEDQEVQEEQVEGETRDLTRPEKDFLIGLIKQSNISLGDPSMITIGALVRSILGKFK